MTKNSDWFKAIERKNKKIEENVANYINPRRNSKLVARKLPNVKPKQRITKEMITPSDKQIKDLK